MSDTLNVPFLIQVSNDLQGFYSSASGWWQSLKLPSSSPALITYNWGLRTICWFSLCLSYCFRLVEKSVLLPDLFNPIFFTIWTQNFLHHLVFLPVVLSLPLFHEESKNLSCFLLFSLIFETSEFKSLNSSLSWSPWKSAFSNVTLKPSLVRKNIRKALNFLLLCRFLLLFLFLS